MKSKKYVYYKAADSMNKFLLEKLMSLYKNEST